MSDTPATRDFGLIDGRAVTGYVLSNRRGTCVFVLDLGGIVQEFSVLADGVRENPVVSFDDAASYADNPFQINKQIGRVAGRIRGAAFDINGRTYRVEVNEGRNALHGGSHGLAVTRFNAVAADGRRLSQRFGYFLPLGRGRPAYRYLSRHRARRHGVRPDAAHLLAAGRGPARCGSAYSAGRTYSGRCRKTARLNGFRRPRSI